MPDGTVDDLDFLDSAFFRNKPPTHSIPTLEQVGARALAENADVTQPKPVRFENPSLVVKFGPHVTIAEAQCLRAIKEVLGGQVSVPEKSSLGVKLRMGFSYKCSSFQVVS